MEGEHLTHPHLIDAVIFTLGGLLLLASPFIVIAMMTRPKGIRRD